MTLRAHLRDRATRVAVLLGSAGIAAGVTVALYAPAPEPFEPVDFGPTYTERLIDRHDCWTGAAPEGVIPTGVLVRYEGETAVRYRGEKAVGDALEFVFEGADNGVVQVAAFCSGGAR